MQGIGFVDGMCTLEGTEHFVEQMSSFIRKNWNVESAEAGDLETSSRPSNDVEGADEAAPGDSGAGADGGRPRRSKAEVRKIRAALNSLDKDNPDHWAIDGEPAIAAVAEIAGIADLTRADLTGGN